ncbi:hypothetical protein P5673_014986 [Acropora cervicornis]|uniref:Uncharacterized protein n=1 Tax=Acropora cervicornis TaxID=6130 RepID=A0AAD9QJS8_ACRCE|nr:hypothetical protein P5673_014986 [Acropora cervicornis]
MSGRRDKCGYHGNATAADPNMAVFVHPPQVSAMVYQLEWWLWEDKNEDATVTFGMSHLRMKRAMLATPDYRIANSDGNWFLVAEVEV